MEGRFPSTDSNSTPIVESSNSTGERHHHQREPLAVSYSANRREHGFWVVEMLEGEGKGPASKNIHCTFRFPPTRGIVRRLDGDTNCFQLQQELLWALLNEESWAHVGPDRAAGSYNSDLLLCLTK